MTRGWPSRFDVIWTAIVSYRWLVIGGVALGFHLLPVIYNLGLPPFDSDSALFSYMGWYMTQGGVPYVDIWDIKPPLIYLVTAGLAVLSGGDMHALYLLGVLLITAVSISSLITLGLLAEEATGSPRAALAAGLFPLILPGFYQIPLGGIRPKYLALMLGVIALFVALHKRPMIAGVFAAMAAASWQWALVYPVLVVLIAVQHSRQSIVRTVLGGFMVAVIVMAPFVLRDAHTAVVAEVMLTPLILGNEGGEALRRIGLAVLLVGYGTFALPIGFWGAVRAIRTNISDYWWIPVGTTWFSLQLLYFDFDWRDDLIHLMVFLGLGAAILVANPPELDRFRRFDPTPEKLSFGILGLVSFAVVLGPFWAGGVEFLLGVVDLSPIESMIPHKTSVHNTYLHEQISNPPSRYGLPAVQELYWSQQPPPACHFRLSIMERELMETIGVTHETYPCGDLDGYLEHF